jgi:hypothetical protein
VHISCSSVGSWPQGQYEAVLDQKRNLLHSFLLLFDAMWLFSHNSEIIAFRVQSEPTNAKHRRSRLLQIMENQTNIWHSKFKIFRTVSSDRTYGSGRSNHKIQRESCLLAV